MRISTAGFVILMMMSAGCAVKSVRAAGARPLATNRIGVTELKGPDGDVASDLIAQGLLGKGYRVVERSQIDHVLSELGRSGDSRFDSASIAAAGRQLGLHELLVGSVNLEGGPLYSFKHANITLRLVDVETGELLWASTYGNPGWTSAISTQGDLQRGAEYLTDEFFRAFPPPKD